ncbi:invasion protein [Ruegeria sp. ANG-R]|uniref:invasion associated locus B family protein n=1 Tax=Ruegeria sp. ANG-R TaxID=1577903 RepID=UPI000580A2FB|nr:invasion associated locus B family protein [Ruegeria sp. ANG-R]KIC42758.1 invasion protein [Ruegeria sp. ANG-R]
MIRKLVPLNMVAAALLCGTAIAQEATEEPETGAEAEVGSDLDLGQSGPRVGEQYVKEQTGDWNISCIKTEGGEDPCAMVQVLSNPQGDPIAEISIGKLPEGGAAVAWANVIVPLETLLQAQLAMSIDGAPRKLYNYHHCIPVGCVAQLGLTQGDVDAMKSGQKAVMSLVPARLPDQILNMDMSLGGFTAGFDGLTASAN